MSTYLQSVALAFVRRFGKFISSRGSGVAQGVVGISIGKAVGSGGEPSDKRVSLRQVWWNLEMKSSELRVFRFEKRPQTIPHPAP